MSRTRRYGLVALLVLSAVHPFVALAQAVVRGFDFVNPVLGFSVAEQNAQLANLRSSGVHVIRFGVEGDVDKNIDFIKRAHVQGIAAVVILHGKYAANAPVRPYRPKDFPGMFQGPPFSFLDPASSGLYFQQFLDKLDASGIALAGLELENEINMAGNNPDFSLPGEGRVLGLKDLYQDPEGKQVAKGYLQYMKALALLKQTRDRSRLNLHTPLLPTSLVEIVQEGPWPQPKKYDGVSAGATLAFFRANGLDKLVDAYNLHTYPWADGPGDKASAIHRQRRLQAYVQPLCSVAGSATGKPCWITEWGFTNDSKSCPSDEKQRGLLVAEMMGDFRQLVQQKRLTGLLFYAWIGESRFDVFRCGALTQTGRLAAAPL